MALLWPSINCLTLGMQPKLSLRVFLLNIFHRKRSINEADERSSDAGFDVFVIRQVEPYNISSSNAFLWRWSLW